MLKAQNEIRDNLKLIDVVIEVLDARAPLASSNPIIDELAKNKARIVVLNKSDLADLKKLDKWKEKFQSEGKACIVTNANINENVQDIITLIKKQGKKVFEEKYKNKSGSVKINPIYRVLVVGIPNVGKSTIINKLAGKQVANVGNKPGVTKKKQWVRISSNIDLLDTPGLLWPRLDDNSAGVKLALTGNIKQEILDLEELACEGLKYLTEDEEYKKLLKEKYRLEDEDLKLDIYELLELVGRRKGCLVSGGNVDMSRASKMFLDDFKSGKLGKISLE